MQAQGTRLWPLLIAIGFSGCLAADAPSSANTDPETQGFTLEISDHRGHVLPAAQAPRAVRIVLDSARALDPSHAPVMLFSGMLDAALSDDLQRAPLLTEHLARLVPCATTYQGSRVTLTPEHALCAGCTYTLAVAGFARFSGGGSALPDDAALGFALTTSSAPSAGARVIASFPAGGAAGVPNNLRMLALVLDGEVRGAQQGVWLEDPSGFAVPTRLTSIPCTEVDARGHTCLQLMAASPLLPLTRYALRTGKALADAHGAQVEPFTAAFTTSAAHDYRRPKWLLTACAIDELPLNVGCALVDDTHFQLRVLTDEATRMQLRSSAGMVAALAPRGESMLQQDQLAPGETLDITLSAVDAAGNAAHASFALRTEQDLPTLAITEVRADPDGAEPDQEFVELMNYGDTPIALDGFVLTDAADEPGEPLFSDAIAYPGARVLLVPDTFNPDDPLDAPVPPGTSLVRVGKALGKAGLSNSGEPLFLRDPLGRRVSAAPASPEPRAGVCNVRVSTEMRSGAPASFGYDAAGRCTPGE